MNGITEIRQCVVHGQVVFGFTGARWRCRPCGVDAVAKRRREVKRLLVEECGGGCVICRYDKYLGGLTFHHRDPTKKEFGLGTRGLTRSIAAMRAEAQKCVLVCVRCHLEIHAGMHPEYLIGEVDSSNEM